MRKAVDGISLEPTPYTSITDSCWWFVVTTTTVGYGDIYPTSTCGRLIAVITMLTGLFIIAVPLSAFSGIWSEEVTGNNKTNDHVSDKSNGSKNLNLNDPTLTNFDENMDSDNNDKIIVGLKNQFDSNAISHQLFIIRGAQSLANSDASSLQLVFDFKEEQNSENKDNDANRNSQSQDLKVDFESISQHLAIIGKAREDIDRAKRNIKKAQEEISEAQEDINRTKKVISQAEKEICCVLRRRGKQIQVKIEYND